MSEEAWDFVGERDLKKSRCTKVCMTCQHFGSTSDAHCHNLLTCQLRRRLLPHGDHLTKRCQQWLVRREREIGWCPEVA